MAERIFHLTAQDGTGIAGTVWEAKRPRALLLWLHGYAEHRRRYANFANWMASNRITVAAVDLRGHGESEGRRGHVKTFEDYFRDLSILLHWSSNSYPKLKCVLGSHSFGSLLAARFLEEGALPREIRALIMTSPFMGLGLEVPPWKTRTARWTGRLIPWLGLSSRLPAKLLSHDERICMSYAHDPLVFRRATVRWYSETVKHQHIVLTRAPFIKQPLLVMQGTEDKITSIRATRMFYETVGSRDKTWIDYHGFYHEILNEVDKLRVYKDMLAWIKKRI